MESPEGRSAQPESELVLPRLDASPSNRPYTLYVALVIVATIAVKFALTRSIPYSQALTDDYDYMYKSLCFLQGDWKLESYGFKKIYTGPAYPLIISPWVLFSQPRAKMLCIYAIHFLLSAAVVAIGTAIVRRFSGKRSLLVPIVLATYAPTFLFNYYAVTENVFFLFLICGMWLSIDFLQTCRNRKRLMLLLALCAMMPLVRTPGYAIIPVIWALLWIHRKDLGGKRVTWLAVAVFAGAVIPEQFFYHFLYGADRMGDYASHLTQRLDDAASVSLLRPIAFFTLSILTHVGYAMLTTGVWMVPAFLTVVVVARRLPDSPTRSAWRNLIWFTFTMAGVLLAFTEVHMSGRAHMNPDDANFVIGRYADPASIVLGFAGLAALLALRKPGWKMQTLLILILPLALYATLRAFDNRVYHPMHDIGLSALALKKLRQYPDLYFWIPIAIVFVVGLISRYWSIAVRVMLVLVIGFNLLTLRNGYKYTSKWSQRIANTLKSADWTVDHLPDTTRLACDKNIRFTSPPPGLPGWKWRNLYNVYMAYVLMVYPRPVEYVRISSDLDSPIEESFGDAEYLLSVLDSAPAVNWGFPVAWHDEYYVIYHLDSEHRRNIQPVDFDAFDFSRAAMRSSDRILMAWHNCSATLREPVSLKAGRYELVISASAQGCTDSPPHLIVELTGRKPVNLEIAPDESRYYRIPLVLLEDGDVRIKLTSNEKPRCADKTDKNIFVESVRIESERKTQTTSTQDAQ
ncbi:MAG: hypothetical protein H6818_02085 [Phycisphaerales bacterium]|nr:hypothetical protein [Phycisphaerales bacterium]